MEKIYKIMTPKGHRAGTLVVDGNSIEALWSYGGMAHYYLIKKEDEDHAEVWMEFVEDDKENK